MNVAVFIIHIIPNTALLFLSVSLQIHALVCLAANYSHVKDTTKSMSREYEQVEDRTPDGSELKEYHS